MSFDRYDYGLDIKNVNFGLYVHFNMENILSSSNRLFELCGFKKQAANDIANRIDQHLQLNT